MKNLYVALIVPLMIMSSRATSAQSLDEIMGQVTDPSAKASYEKEYAFDIYLQVETSEAGGQSMALDAYLARDGSHTAILFTGMGEKTVVVIDTENRAILILSNADGEKTGIAMTLNPEALEELTAGLQTELADQSYANSKTGRQKQILGYQCDEYMVKEGTVESRIWLSEKLGNELEPVLAANQEVFGGALIKAEGLNGMVMEFENREASGEDITSMKVTGLDLKANFRINTGDYAIMSMGQ